jgi:plasmid stabilization system protein ParE
MAHRHRRVIWTEQASKALDEALTYIAQDSLDGAQAVLEQALAAADALATLSERGRAVPEMADPALREVFVYSYRLIYEIVPQEVRILAFVHGARDFGNWRRGQ